MTAGSDDMSDDDDDGTVIIPGPQAGRAPPPPAAAPPLSVPSSSAEDDDEATTVILPGPGRAPRGPEPPPRPPQPAPPRPPEPAAPRTPQPSPPPPAPQYESDEELTAIVTRPPDPATTGGDLKPGTVLGNYRVGKLIARGGLGAIYDGVNIHNPAERVAIKTILPEPGQTERFAKALLDESTALMRVRHDAVVPYRTYGRIGDSGEFYLVLEFVDGDALNDFYRRRRLNEREIFALARRLATGLQAAHEEGLVHRDISPDNVLLQNNQLEKATLIDFGIAKIGDLEDSPDTQFAGKLSYAAPEQFERGGRIGPWTDVYSLALLLIAAARGQPINMGKTIEEAQEMRRAVPELKGIPASLIEPLSRMLEPHPADRPQSMLEVIARLDQADRTGGATSSPAAPPAAAKSAPAPVVAPKGPVRRSAPTTREPRKGGGLRRSLISAVLALIVGAIAVAGVMTFGDDLFGGKPPAKPGNGDSTGTTTAGTPGTGTTGTPPAGPGPVEPGPVTIPPPPPPPAVPRGDQLAKIVDDFRGRLAANPCTLAGVSGSDSGSAFALAVTGAWGDDAAIRTLVSSAASSSGVNATVTGEAIDPALCSAADQLKALSLALGGRTITRPQPAGTPDRAVAFELTVDPALPFVAVYEVDGTGGVTQLIDAAPDKRAQLVASNKLADLGGGRYRVTLVPPANGNASQTLLIAVASVTAFTSPGGGAKDFAGAVAAAKAGVSIVPRDGVPLAPPPPPPPPPPPVGKSRAELMADARAAILSRFAALPCNAVRLEISDDGQAIAVHAGGVWGDAAAMQAAATQLSGSAGARVDLTGRAVDPAFCPALDALRATAPELGPPMLGAPQASTSSDRATAIEVTPAADRPALYLYEADRTGHLAPLADLGTPEARAKAVQSGLAQDIGGGRLALKLVPTSPAANADPTLLIAVSAAAPPAGFGFDAPSDLAALARAFAPAGKALGLDLAERPGIPAAPPPPPPPVAGDAFADVRAGFRAVGCSLIRLEPGAGGASVLGVWGDAKAVQSAADAASAQAKQTFALGGDTVTDDLCATLDRLKPFYADTAPAGLGKATPAGTPDHAVGVDIIADPAFANLYLFVVDPSGRIAGLLELSDPAKLAVATGAGYVQATGDGRYHVILPPYSATPDTRASLLVTVMSKDKLTPALFGYAGATGTSGWAKGLAELAKTVPLRIDAAALPPAP